MPDGRLASIAECPGGATISVYVVPRSSVNGVIGLHDGEVKIALAAPPVDGAANKALVEFIARRLGVPKGEVILLSGKASRHKMVRVSGVTALEVTKGLIPDD